MNINVINLHRPLQFITVTTKEDDIIVDCNHAGAEFEHVAYGADETEYIIVCDKCNAQFAGEEWVL